MSAQKSRITDQAGLSGSNEKAPEHVTADDLRKLIDNVANRLATGSDAEAAEFAASQLVKRLTGLSSGAHRARYDFLAGVYATRLAVADLGSGRRREVLKAMDCKTKPTTIELELLNRFIPPQVGREERKALQSRHSHDAAALKELRAREVPAQDVSETLSTTKGGITHFAKAWRARKTARSTKLTGKPKNSQEVSETPAQGTMPCRKGYAGLSGAVPKSARPVKALKALKPERSSSGGRGVDKPRVSLIVTGEEKVLKRLRLGRCALISTPGREGELIVHVAEPLPRHAEQDEAAALSQMILAVRL